MEIWTTIEISGVLTEKIKISRIVDVKLILVRCMASMSSSGTLFGYFFTIMLETCHMRASAQ